MSYKQLVTGILLLLSMSAIGAAQDNKKLEYGILVDSTGSMRSQFATVVTLAKGVVHQVHDHGPVSIFSFDSEGIGRGSRAVPASRIDRAQDENLLNRTIEGIYVQGGQTMLLDAIEFMAERLNREPPATARIIVLITDGEDRVSERSLKEVIQKLKETRTSVYAIGLVRELEGSKRTKATDLLKSITKETGGRAVFPKSDDPDSKDLLAELAIPFS